MTTCMRAALEKAKREPIRRVHQGPGQPPWPAPANSLRALLRHGYVTYEELISRKGFRVQQWRISELGKEALKAPTYRGEDRPVFLSRPSKTSGDYTRDPSRRIDELEIIDPSRLAFRWRRESLEERIGAQDPKKAAGRLARSLRAA